MKLESRMQLEDNILYRNFKGEPWTVPLHPQGYPNIPSWHSSLHLAGFQEDMRPMFLLFKIMGIFPIHFESNGEFAFKLLSLLTLYSALIQGGIVITAAFTLKERIERMANISTNFNDNILEVGCILCFIPAFLGPLTHLPETAKKARFFREWKNLQKEFRCVAERDLRFGQRWKARIKMAKSWLVSSVFTALLLLLQRGFTWWQAAIFGYCNFLNNLMTDFWVLATDAFIIIADEIEKDLTQCLSRKCSGNASAVVEYGILWRHLSKLMQDLGNNMGYTYGGQVVLYFVLHLVGTFGFVSQAGQAKPLTTLGFLTSGLIFSWLTYVFCNAADRATKHIGREFQEKLRHLMTKFPSMDTETKDEIRAFLETVIAYPPEISLCGFVQVDRGLQTSLVASTVTYLVVLAQFQISSRSDEMENNI